MEGRIDRVYDGVYHANHGNDEEELEDSEQWLDFGDDKEEDCEAALRVALEDASKNEISDEGKIKLENLIEKYKNVIEISINS